MTIYQIIDRHTDAIVATRMTRARARLKADRLDLEYGAIRYFVREAPPVLFQENCTCADYPDSRDQHCPKHGVLFANTGAIKDLSH